MLHVSIYSILSSIIPPAIFSASLCHLRLKAPVEAFCITFCCASWALGFSPRDTKSWAGFSLGLPLKFGFGTFGPIWAQLGPTRGDQSKAIDLLDVVDARPLLKGFV